MGKFFNGKVKKSSGSYIQKILIVFGILLIIVLIALILLNRNKKPKDKVSLTLKDNLRIEVNSEKPNVKDFFSKFENYDEKNIEIDYKDFDISKIGEYDIVVKIKDYGDKNIKLIVEDTKAPVLKLKELHINSNEPYNIEDFIESCKDNSGSECVINYYNDSKDENGVKVDYSSYKDDGTYVIKIIAKDINNNETKPVDTKLIIGNGVSEETTCKFGNLNVDSKRVTYPIAIIVGDETKGCALDRNLWDNDNTQKEVNELYMKDYKALKSDLKDILVSRYPNGANIVAYPNFAAVLNDDLTGLVGYAIYVKVYIGDANSNDKTDKDENLVLSYYIKKDGTRQYDINKFNLK